jgi:hypothetical protein
VLTKDDPNNPFMKLFSDYSAGDISGDELKRQWAETVLRAEKGDEDVPVDVENPQDAAPKKQISRRAELAKRVTRSTKDVGEQLWRVNMHSKFKFVTARSQAQAIEKASMIDSDFGREDARARIATDLEKAQYQLDQEREQQRDSERDAEQIRARLGVPQTADAVGDTGHYRVIWDERRDGGIRSDALNVDAPNATAAMDRVRDALQLQGRDIVQISADAQEPPAWRQRTIHAPGSTQDTTQQSGEWTGHWIVRDSQGRELTRFHGIGNNQSDANRYAAGWLGRNRPNMVGQEVEVVPEMR